MPNWCYSYVTINGPESELNVLDDNFHKAWGSEGTKTDFGDTWLGSLVEYLGKNYEDVSCRGSILDYDYYGGQIRLSTEAAWSPTLQPILMMMEKYAPHARITYQSEEPGCELYLTNDDDLAECYRVETWDDEFDPGPEPFCRDELKEWLEETVLKKRDGFCNLIEEAMSRYEIYIHKYEFCEVWDA